MKKMISFIVSTGILIFGFGNPLSVGSVEKIENENQAMDICVQNLDHLEQLVHESDQKSAEELKLAWIELENTEKQLEKKHFLHENSFNFEVYKKLRNELKETVETKEKQIEKKKKTSRTKKVIHSKSVETKKKQPTPVETTQQLVPMKTEESNSQATAPSVETQEKETPAVKSLYQPNHIYLENHEIPYVHAGIQKAQQVIDANPNGMAATYGGAEVFSGTDGMNTHFIGHNPGAFSVLFSLHHGSQIVVTDSAGTPHMYSVRMITICDDSGYTKDGKDLYPEILGNGTEEKITLQTCINDAENLIVFAHR